MGIIILLLSFLIVAEVALLSIRIRSKSHQLKLTNISRIGQFTIFIVLTLLQIIEWSPRYYGLALILSVLAVTSTASVVRNNKVKIVYRSSRVVLKGVGMILLLILITFPAILFPQYRGLAVTGHYSVAKLSYTYTDPNRIETFTENGENRRVNVGLWYPEGADNLYPLIVFSHGGISIKTSNESLYNELASHGYIVASIDHPYHSLYTTGEDGNRILIDSSYMSELNTEDAKKDPQQSHELYNKWMSLRTGDINFVIDYVLSQARSANPEAVYKMIDKEKIGVVGHSLGGSAALLVGRVREDIKAVMALESPFMGDIKDIVDGRFVFIDDAYPVPVLNVYSDSSWNHLGNWPQYEKNYRLLSATNGSAYNVYISGAGHFSLTDLSLTSPVITRVLNGFKSDKDSRGILEIINEVSLEFFNYYLKGYDTIDIKEIY